MVGLLNTQILLMYIYYIQTQRNCLINKAFQLCERIARCTPWGASKVTFDLGWLLQGSISSSGRLDYWLQNLPRSVLYTARHYKHTASQFNFNFKVSWFLLLFDVTYEMYYISDYIWDVTLEYFKGKHKVLLHFLLTRSLNKKTYIKK